MTVSITAALVYLLVMISLVTTLVCRLLKSHKRTTRNALLLCCFNTPERREMTRDIVSYYHTQLPLHRIYMVDSANHGCDLLPEHQQVKFDQNSECVVTTCSTDMELCSLKKAVNSLDFGDAEYVIKLTCKYKIPDLKKLVFKRDLVLQALHRNHWQNTELYAVNVSKIHRFIDDIDTQHGLMEERMYTVSKKYEVKRMRKLRNLASYPRGNKEILKEL